MHSQCSQQRGVSFQRRVSLVCPSLYLEPTDLLPLHLVCLGMLSQGARISVPLRAAGVDTRIGFLKKKTAKKNKGGKQCYRENSCVVNF